MTGEVVRRTDAVQIHTRGSGHGVALPEEDPCRDGDVIVFGRVFEADPYQHGYVYAAVRINGIYWLTQRGVGGDTAVPARRWHKLRSWLGDYCLGMIKMVPSEVIDFEAPEVDDVV